MTTLVSSLLGTDRRAQRSPRIPQPLLAMLIITVASFYIANSFASPLSYLMFQAKWLPLAVLTGLGVTMLQHRLGPRLPLTMMIVIGALLVVGALGILTSVDPAFSALSWLTIGGCVLCGYVVSALVIATDSRRSYFELLANFARVFALLTALFVLAGINMGRGGGLTAWCDNPNTLAAILSPGMVIFFAGCIERRPGWLVFHLFFFVLTFALIWMTNARASVIWLGLSLCAFWLYRRGPGMVVFGVIVGLIISVGWWYPIRNFLYDTLGLGWSLRDTMAGSGISPLSGREEVWRVGWDLFQERPVTGYGLGSSQEIIRAEAWRFVKHQGSHFHSSYIMVAVEMGFFGALAFLAVIFTTVVRAVADSARTAMLPRESWPLAALPFALVFGAMGHAVFESWLLAPGNANMVLFWTWVWMIHHQSQVQVHAVRQSAPQVPAGATLPAR